MLAGTILNGRLVVTVRDFGEGPMPHPEHAGLGMGITLMAMLGESVEIKSEDPGTLITLRFRLPAA